jgi:ribosomal protein L35
MKTNKSLLKRLKITKNGKILCKKPGFNHFNSRQRRVKQLNGKKMREFTISNKEKARFLPGML